MYTSGIDVSKAEKHKIPLKMWNQLLLYSNYRLYFSNIKRQLNYWIFVDLFVIDFFISYTLFQVFIFYYM